jgi:tellurium resistance protein TerD
MEQKILQKGANLSLSKTVPGLNGVNVSLGWKLPPNYSHPFDVDSCVFLLTQQGQVRTDADLIYYNNRASVCGTVELLDNSTNEDLEVIRADLNKLPTEIVRLVFAVTIHEATSRQQHFKLLSEVVIKISNPIGNCEIVRYVLSQDAGHETAMILGEVYRYNSEWKFKAIGQGYDGGFKALSANFGIIA